MSNFRGSCHFAESEGLLFNMLHRRDSAIFVMLRISADVTDSLRCFLLLPWYS